MGQAQAGGPYGPDSAAPGPQVVPVPVTAPGTPRSLSPDQLMRLAPLRGGLYTVAWTVHDYVTFELQRLADDPTAQRAVAWADSRHSLSMGGQRAIVTFAMVRGRYLRPVARLLDDTRPEILEPVTRLLRGLWALLSGSTDVAVYRAAWCLNDCGRILTTPRSIRNGMGPTCAAKAAR